MLELKKVSLHVELLILGVFKYSEGYFKCLVCVCVSLFPFSCTLHATRCPKKGKPIASTQIVLTFKFDDFSRIAPLKVMASFAYFGIDKFFYTGLT